MFQEWFKKFEKYKKENCEYCCKGNKVEIHGKDFELKPTAGFKRDRKYSSWIMKGKTDKYGNYADGKWYLIGKLAGFA